jgi:uncharacterized protein (TIGR04222 family)
MLNLNPLDLPGPAFLAFYVFSLIIAHFLGKALMQWCRSNHAEAANVPNDLHSAEAAFLAGGTERAVDTALVQLLHADLITVKPSGGGFETKADKPDTLQLGDLQRDVYREIAHKKGSVDALHRLKSAALTRAQVRLAGGGLLLARGSPEANCARGANALPFAAVIALGIVKIFVGIARHRPVTFLIVFVLVSLVLLGIKVFKLPLRSARGEAALKNLRRRNAALETTVRRRSRELDDATLLFAVALFGPQVLATSEFAWMHQGFVNRQSGSSDGGGGGSCGGGGGGGGCGGCGG